MGLFGLKTLIALTLFCQVAQAETLSCSTWHDTTTCTGPDGYVSHESRWHDWTNGDDNRGHKWTTSRWHDWTTTTITN